MKLDKKGTDAVVTCRYFTRTAIGRVTSMHRATFACIATGHTTCTARSEKAGSGKRMPPEAIAVDG